jgi:hypothetical protein
MEFPDDVLTLIREYSKPMTRPDWKRLHKFPHAEFGIRLFIGSRYSNNRIFMTTFKKACVVMQDMQIESVQVPQFCAFRGKGCTTKSKTKRHCSKCSTPVCLSCKKCVLHR